MVVLAGVFALAGMYAPALPWVEKRGRRHGANWSCRQLRLTGAARILNHWDGKREWGRVLR